LNLGSRVSNFKTRDPNMGTCFPSVAQAVLKKKTHRPQVPADVRGEGKTSRSIRLRVGSSLIETGESVMSTKKKKAAKAEPAAAQPADAPVITGVDKIAAEVSYQTLVNGLGTVLANVSSFELPSGTYTRGQLIGQFQQRIAAAEATKASNTTWRENVAAERELAAVTDPLRDQVRQVAIARLGKASAKLKQLGFTPAKKRQVPVATKAEAQSKAKGTRALRGTKGVDQKKAADAALAAAQASGAKTSSP
jgi:hypothetical protein